MKERNKLAELLGWYDEGPWRRRLVGFVAAVVIVNLYRWCGGGR